MKTLTVTYHHTTNYGAVLQAYALQQTILSLGHDNLILEYVLKSWKRKKRKSIRNLYIGFVSWKRRKTTRKLIHCFKEFHTNRLLLTKPYTSIAELKSNPPDVDCYITGSDQVWNLSNVKSWIDSRLLQFGAPSAIRFSYAASMEGLSLSDEQKERLDKALCNYKGISLREQSAIDYIESFSSHKCRLVLDPVFLLSPEKWGEIAKVPRVSGPFILCYQVQSNKRIQKVARFLKRKTGYPIVSICNSSIKWIHSDFTFFDVSVEEFIGFYQNASFVVSASFHGVALGLVFNKPTYALIKGKNSNRIKGLMHLFDLDDYVVDQDQYSKVQLYRDAVLDQVKSIKSRMIDESMLFLRQMFAQ